MKSLRTLLLLFSTSMMALLHLPAFGQASSFTYQGQLRQAGQPFTGMADLEFRLYDQSNGGNEIGGAQARPGWPVEDGLFQVELDFGAAAFNGGDRFLEVSVHGALLNPRQKLTATPYALLAKGLASGSVDGGSIDPTEVQLRANGSCPDNEPIRLINQDGSFTCDTLGEDNLANGFRSSVGGGRVNSASGSLSRVGGGALNVASGFASTVSGGSNNEAAGDYSFVAGLKAKNSNSFHNGVFMFADSQNADFLSTRADAFFVRAQGGAEFRVDDFGFRAYSNATGSSRAALQGRSENPAGIAIYGANNSTDSTLVLNNGGSGDIIRGFNIGALQLQLQSDGDLVIGGSLTQNSDRNRKEAIEPVDVQAVLEALRELPMFSWRYKHDREAAPHIGPMAQDFHAAFGLGSTPNGIAVVDAQGVALASLQALDQELASLSSENRALRQQLAELETRYDARIEALQERQEGDRAALRQELAMLRDLVAPRVAQETR